MASDSRLRAAVAVTAFVALATSAAAQLDPRTLIRGGNERLVDGIAAQVGGEIVLLSEVTQLSAPIEMRMREAGVSESEVRMMRADILERLIESRLIEGVVRRLELEASDAELTQAIQGIAQEAGLTLEQLANSVTSHGLTIEQYRDKIRDEIERTKVLSTMVRSRVEIEEYELLALFTERHSDQRSGGEEVDVLHLVVGFQGRDQASACEIVAAARGRIASGEVVFEQEASRISDANKQSGGRLGWIHTADIAGWMAPVVADLRPGELSAVITTGFGCNLLMLTQRREFVPVTFEGIRPELENQLFRQKMAEEYTKWIDTLRRQTYIERKGVYAEATRLGSEDSSTP